MKFGQESHVSINLQSFLTVRNRIPFGLYKKNKLVAKFDLEVLVNSSIASVASFAVEEEGLLPIPLRGLTTPLKDTFLKWLERRFIPKNREFYEEVMKTLGDESILTKLDLTLGLSLLDDYWVQREGSNHDWKDINLFDNQFNRHLENFAFIGFGDEIPSGLRTSPEYTTDGMLRKVWRRHGDGSIHLYKAGTSGYSNADLEPYSEFLSTQVLATIGLKHVPYGLSNFKGRLCSVCPLMTSDEVSMVSAGSVYPTGNVLDILNESGPEEYSDLVGMFAFDLITGNADRHAGNYAYLFDNKDMSRIGVAPIFDNGVSLIPYFVPERYTLDEVDEYLSTKKISFLWVDPLKLDVYKSLLDKKARDAIRKLLKFEFEPHPNFEFPVKRLVLLSKMVRERASKLL